jgi:hypothetical protein
MKLPFMVFAFLILFLLSCSKYCWTKKDFTATNSQLDSVSIIFPHIEYIDRKSTTHFIKQGYSIYIATNVADDVKQIIDDGNFYARSSELVLDSMVVGTWIPQYLFNSCGHYRCVDEVLFMGKPGNKVFPMTNELKLLIDKSSAPYVLFINGLAFGLDDDEKQSYVPQLRTFDLPDGHAVADDSLWNGILLHFYLIDKRTSEIIWYTYTDSHDATCDPLNRDALQGILQRMLTAK